MSRGGAIRLVAVCLAIASCARRQPAASDAAAVPPPAPPAPPVAAVPPPEAPDAGDAGVDGPPPSPRPRSTHAAAAQGGGGGMAGLKVTGNIPTAEVAKVLRAGTRALRACYDKERARNAALAGKVAFHLEVDERGRVTLAEVVKSTLGGGDPELCMVRAARDFKFPKATGGGESTINFQAAFAR
jgi:outer membrane biosynthesis protein TonB